MVSFALKGVLESKVSIPNVTHYTTWAPQAQCIGMPDKHSIKCDLIDWNKSQTPFGLKKMKANSCPSKCSLT